MKTTRPWITVGGALLALSAGWTNAIGLVAATHAVLTHLTGTATQAATDLVAGDFLLVGKAAVLVLSFLLGSFLVGAVVHVSGEDVPPVVWPVRCSSKRRCSRWRGPLSLGFRCWASVAWRRRRACKMPWSPKCPAPS